MQYPITTAAWTKIAAARSTVEVETLSWGGLLLAVSATQPQPGADGEPLDGTQGANIRRTFDTPLPAALYAIAATTAGASVEVQPIGGSGSASIYGPSGVTPVTGSLTAAAGPVPAQITTTNITVTTGQSAAFVPLAGRSFNFSL